MTVMLWSCFFKKLAAPHRQERAFTAYAISFNLPL